MSDTAGNTVVRLERLNGVGIIKIDNPPINAGSTAVRQGLLAAISELNADDSLTGAILMGAGKMFMAGSDMREFHAPVVEPHLTTVIQAIEDSPKPVLAAIAGAALGGGYELALGCDARIAAPDAVVGLPECVLGMMPGAGGTQRLPRLIGIEKSIELICAGTRVKAPEAARIGMVEAVGDGDLLQSALDFLRKMAGEKRKTIKLPVLEADEAALEKVKTTALKAGRNRPNIRLAIEAIENCRKLPPEGALKAERAVFLELRAGREAAALRHLFFAERNTAKIPGLTGVAARSVEMLAVIGGGTMGAGIAATFLSAGKPVILVENAEEAAQAARGRVRASFQRQLERGRITPEAFEQALARLTVTTNMARSADADAVIEAVVEDLDVKRQVFAELGRIVKPGTALLTNTSYLSVTEIADASGRPKDVAGMHFFSPAEVMRLVEIVRHPKVDPPVLATAVSLARSAGKLPIVARDSFGFIGNRIYAAYRRQCEFMLEEGALPQEVDRVLEDFGFAMGPFAVADLSGLDVAWRMRQATAERRDPSARYVRIPDMLCEMGRFGRKSGAGYYRYTQDDTREVDPEVTALVERASREAGRPRRAFSPAEIVERALAAMASEAAFVISEQVTAAPSDVDLVLTNGYGFPRHEGGVVFWAQHQPKADLQAAFRRLVEAGGAGFRLGPIDALQPMPNAAQ
jgi:3-hydroxyacyl-CoA dehydrogenase